jgi:predicted O-methyltransferase YrrM/GR25 family glycosyltransferase involved in LPS biosynthesis
MNHIFDQPQFGEPWFSFPNLYSRMVEKFPSGSKFVEIGSWKGKSSAYMAVEIANSNKKIDFYCVDTWEGSIEHAGMEELPRLYDIFIDNMRPVESYYFPLKLKSLEAVSKFEDKSLDFVFIDASHEYEDVKNDIIAWLPKVKPGGVLAGHDYYIDGYDWFPGVKQAVNEQLDNFEVEENCFIYKVPANDQEKLKNFPSINFVSIEESQNRRDLLYKQFEEYNLTKVTPHIFEKYDDSKHTLVGNSLDKFVGNVRGPVTSHLKAIKKWYFDTDEEYAFFCEDDLSFETVKYWNFTWEEFFNNLPKDWGCVQLCWVREYEMFRFSYSGLKLRPRCWCDWSACAYLITRDHAKKLISNYYRDGTFNLDYVGNDQSERPEWALRPTAETIIFSKVSPVYGIPIFVENSLNFKSTWADQVSFPNEYSYHTVIDWWKTEGKNFSISDLMNMN